MGEAHGSAEYPAEFAEGLLLADDGQVVPIEELEVMGGAALRFPKEKALNRHVVIV